MGEAASSIVGINTISPYKEVIAWESLWGIHGQTSKTMKDVFRGDILPSEAFTYSCGTTSMHTEVHESVLAYWNTKSFDFDVLIKGSYQFPDRIFGTKHPFDLLYFKGDVSLINQKSISIVGTRSATAKGRENAVRIASKMIEMGFVVVSGLAKGIDTAAMEAAVKAGGKVVGVIGTPIDEYYPKENTDLQNEVANNHLLISHVPFYRYDKEPFSQRRLHFLERNQLMAALSEATVIVEASDTSGTLVQARACIDQGRKLFILGSCFEGDLKWPEKYLGLGAIRVNSLRELYNHF